MKLVMVFAFIWKQKQRVWQSDLEDEKSVGSEIKGDLPHWRPPVAVAM